MTPFSTHFSTPKNQPASCIDSLEILVTPASCHGLKDGAFRVKTVFGGQAPYYFSFDDVNFSTNPVFEKLWAGTHTLFVRDSLGCLFEEKINVPEPEELKVSLWSDKTLVHPGELFTIYADVTPNTVEPKFIEWRPPSLFENHKSLAQKLSISESTDFAIEISSGNGCTAYGYLHVDVEKAKIYAPNIIKPGSSPNSFFTLYAGEGVSQIAWLRVYSRWGNLIFENQNFPPNDPFKGWNGKVLGKKAVSGIYFWSAEVEYWDGSREVLNGDMSVFRDVY